MAKEASVRAFKCPSCGAPIEPEVGNSSMKCPYCNDTVIIPSSLRASAPLATAPTYRANYSPSSNYSRDTGYSDETYSSAGSSRAPKFITSRLITVFFVVIIIGAIVSFVLGFNPFGTLLFANQVMTFGSKGIGQGMFQNARTLGVDGNGNIVVADYENGRVQIFDPNGKFKSMFTVSENGKKINILGEGMAVSRDGKIYIANSPDVLVYDESGQSLGKISGDLQGYRHVVIGADDTLYALSGFPEDNITRFKKDGSIDLQIPNAISSLGSNVSTSYMAVDGLGNMYITSSSADAVFKYSPQGKFINQWGSKNSNSNHFDPGQFYDAEGIAVDGYGRVYVSDVNTIQVFDATGKYINNFEGYIIGLTIDSQNNVYVTTGNQVRKLQVQRPSGK